MRSTTRPDTGEQWQVSTGNGTYSKWRRDGKELFYLAPDATLMAVSIKSAGPSLEAGVPAALFKAPFILAGLSGRRDYDVSADRRFLLNITAPAEVLPTPITVILNWAAGLKK